MTLQTPVGLAFGQLDDHSYKFLVEGLSRIAICGHVELAEIDWCGSCKARQLRKIIVESWSSSNKPHPYSRADLEWDIYRGTREGRSA
jgi:hypothetical protein